MKKELWKGLFNKEDYFVEDSSIGTRQKEHTR
jgi:hypothetical protein